MTKRADIPRVQTGIPNLDAIFNGGLPKGSVVVVGGPPGSGKTTLCQQICFHNATPKSRVLIFGTLSEPTAKTLRYLRQFTFFDPQQLHDGSVQFVDLGAMLRSEGLEAAAQQIMLHIKKVKPSMVVIDSFKVFDDLAKTKEELRKFGYEIAVNLMAWEITALLLGEYSAADYQTNPLFSIVDGLIVLSQRESLGENQRFFEVVKLRGTAHSRDEHPFLINARGVEIFAPRVAIKREPLPSGPTERCKTGISRLDTLLGPGIPWGSSLLISGVAGTGKTVLSLEFIYRGALAGERGILFSFEETEERLRAAAAGLGWDLEHEIKRGMVEIVFIPQPDIMVEANLLMMQQRIEALKARRVVIDSVSVFLHKVKDPQLSREKLFQLSSVVQNANAVGFFPTDIPYGSNQVSRLGVEETVVDGVIILTSTQEDMERQRYVEVYKLRNTAHLNGRHPLTIGHGGVTIFPRHGEETVVTGPPHALDPTDRLGSGVAGLDALLRGGLLRRSVTLLSGSAGVGKSTFGLQFLLEGAAQGQRGLHVSFEEGPEQLLAGADALGLPLRAAVKQGRVRLLYASRENIREGQFLTLLSDELRTGKVDRLVLDAVTQMLTEHLSADEYRQVLYKLLLRLKAQGITSLLTVEASSLYSNGRVTEQRLSPLADNLLMLRYSETAGELWPTLTIVKTRGSEHDRGTHPIIIGKTGVQVGFAAGGEPGSRRRPASRKRPARKGTRRGK